jgi:acyl-CoA thioester hydrolase
MVTVTDRVRFVETDMMGVVHHANYLRWFEMGRVEYMRQAGVYLLDLMAAGILFPITDVACQYRASARFDDQVAIETTMVELSKAKMVFSYRVLNAADGRLLASGSTKNAFTDQAGKVIRLPAEYFDKLHSLYSTEPAGS